MQNHTAKEIIQRLLSLADITINGTNPWDFHVHDERVYERILRQPSLGLGEAYVAGWWDCAQLDEFFFRIARARLDVHIKKHYQWLAASIFAKLNYLKNRLINHQSKTKALEVGKAHYDIGNDLYQAMLDKCMVYTCGYWRNSNNLDDAQLAKLDLVCRKLQLQAGMRVLDIGCGWGSFAKFAAENYGVTVVGITISKEQKKLAEQLCSGLPVEIRFQDYRDIREQFDRVCSLGMFEHVGYKNYYTYMQAVGKCLKADGLFLLHTIGNNVSTVHGDPWVNKYIFPNGMLPSIKQIGKIIEKLFVMEDWHNFGADYAKTLCAWQKNIEDNWTSLQAKYDQGFRRMWYYYLLSFAGTFRARSIQLWQIVLSKQGVIGGYESVR